VVQAFERYYRKAVGDLGVMWQRLSDGGYVRNTELLPFVNEVVERYLADRQILAALALWQPQLPVYVEHCLASAVYSLFIAQRLEYSRAQARDVVLAALFHDVGYTMIPQRLLDAERSLSKGERRILFRHIEHAILLTGRLDWPGEDWRLAIYQHQERGTGAGYPSGYRAERIHEYARILAIADVFHALVSDRPHRKAYPAAHALKMVMKMGAMGLLDARLVRLFARELSLYPIGSTVELSTGETARVVGATRDPLSPWVGIILSSARQRLAAPKILDLSNFPGQSIIAEMVPFEEPFAGF
jgi:HD-GYP domain-containing protein (c-di-GMP phosphodiesterase class II)